MSHETYTELFKYIEAQYTVFHAEYVATCDHLQELPYKARTVALDVAYDWYRKQCARLTNMKNELFVAAQATYKNHPNKKMREFWLLKK